MAEKKRPKRIKSRGKFLLQWVEVFLGSMVLVAVAVASVVVIVNMVSADWSSIDTFTNILKVVLELAIGVELARLLFSYSTESIVELAIFVVARKLLLLDGDYLALLLGIVALVLLIATRRIFMDEEGLEGLFTRVKQRQ